MSGSMTLEDEILWSVTNEPEEWHKYPGSHLSYVFKLPTGSCNSPLSGPTYEIEIGLHLNNQDVFIYCNGYVAPVNDPDKVRDAIERLRYRLGTYHSDRVKDGFARRRIGKG